MADEKVSNLLDELIQMLSKYEAEELEAFAERLSNEKTIDEIKSIALTLADLKRKVVTKPRKLKIRKKKK